MQILRIVCLGVLLLAGANASAWAEKSLEQPAPKTAPTSEETQARDARWMSTDRVQSTFRGKVIEGFYPNDTTFAEMFSVGGSVIYIDQDGKQARGDWSVAGRGFCTMYQPDGGGCFLVQKVSDNCYAFHSYARNPEAALQGGTPSETWAAKAWIKGSPSTCIKGQAI